MQVPQGVSDFVLQQVHMFNFNCDLHIVAERIAREEKEKYYAEKNVLQSETGIEETSPAPGVQPPLDGNN